MPARCLTSRRRGAHAARSRRGEIERLGAVLRDLDQLRNGLGGKRFVSDERHRLGGHHAHGGEILFSVVRQLLPDRRIDQQGIGGDEHGVAVGRRLGDGRGRHDRAGARAVLDHHRLAVPARRQEIGKDARHHVGWAAGRKRHQQLYRSGGKLGRRLRGGGADRGPEQHERQRDDLHCFHYIPCAPANCSSGHEAGKSMSGYDACTNMK